MSSKVKPIRIKNKIRVVTAASLFDGHDASINIMRRIIQNSGCEVIHLGHNRSVQEIVHCAIQEDVQGIAITSYQGGHMEYLKYMVDMLRDADSSQIKIFAGGGGVILPKEIEELETYGVDRIYSPEDGRKMGLQGMINDMLSRCDFPTGKDIAFDLDNLSKKNPKQLASLISAVENYPETSVKFMDKVRKTVKSSEVPVLGITGTGGSGKSSLVDELTSRILLNFPEKAIAILSVDPSRRKTGGALLCDRIRMNAINSDRVFMRSLATRQSNLALSRYVQDAVDVMKAAAFDLIVLETSGIGQSDTEITDHSDICLYVMTPEYGAGTQLEKIDMLDFADFIAINKFDKRGAKDAIRDVKKQFRRNHELWEEPDEKIPVFGTIASHFNDEGVNNLYQSLIERVNGKWKESLKKSAHDQLKTSHPGFIIPPQRDRYLSEISETVLKYNKWVESQVDAAQKLFGIDRTLSASQDMTGGQSDLVNQLKKIYKEVEGHLDQSCKNVISDWFRKIKRYKEKKYTYQIRNQKIQVDTHVKSLANSSIPKISLPRYQAWGDVLRWSLQENVPGEFPYTSGVFPFKREEEDPTRMFAGEGGPERTNRRFHYLSQDQPAKRLSTAFDAVTLYGEDPDMRPDIHGKIGNAGVSICCLDDAKKLYSGFHLSDPKTSVSMTINGPAPIMAAFFMNTVIDQECEIYIKKNGLEKQVKEKIKTLYSRKGMVPPVYQGDLPKGNDGLGLLLLGVTGDEVLPADIYQKIKEDGISRVRGTVQADILKEDQAQNTCIFSSEFALRMMGDVQEYFIQNKVKNFYSVSISGYHIAEAGANPITQLAFTLANGFTYVEYFLSRGMSINNFGPNLSFFFSNGMEPEYAVIGRVARRIWAKAMKLKYNADERSQKLKYHIQTSGRSLHSQDIDFNDIRTTLQALYAINDHCNSLHTNSYDEAITTPTEESVRRAMAIQLIINQEFGLAKSQNPIQGSFVIEELTDLVEEAVMEEFERISERGGVLGAMETNYQRGKIQDESMIYEKQKESGDYPIVGVNTFLSAEGSPFVAPGEVIRATDEEKNQQIQILADFHKFHSDACPKMLKKLQKIAIDNGNIFENLMDTVKHCSIGQISNSLYEVGGRYRRNM